MTSTALAIERALGTDCTDEFHELHAPGQLYDTVKSLREHSTGHHRVC